MTNQEQKLLDEGFSYPLANYKFTPEGPRVTERFVDEHQAELALQGFRRYAWLTKLPLGPSAIELLVRRFYASDAETIGAYIDEQIEKEKE